MSESLESPWQQTSLLPLVATPTTTPAPSADQLLILDTETTGLDPEADQVLEVGAILFSVPQRAVLAQLSFLIPVECNAAEPLNGIAPAATQAPSLGSKACCCCSNSPAARSWLWPTTRPLTGNGLAMVPLPDLQLPWLCTMEDIHWPAERLLRPRPSVRDLALAYGVPVWAAHRALTDCIYLAQVFERCVDLEQLIAEGREPRHLYRAQVSYDERHLAREAGFRWNDPVNGAWSRRLSERQLEALKLPFNVVPVAS